MEDTTRDPKTGCDGELPALTAARRQQARDYLTAQQRRLGELESALAHQVGQLSQELAQARQATLETEAELVESRSQLEATAKKLRLDERGLAQLHRENEANAEELAYHRQRLHQKLAELEIEREKLDELQAETKSQRRRIAHQLKTQREDDRRALERARFELDQRRAELADPEALNRQLAEVQERLLEAEEKLKESERHSPPEPSEDLAQALEDMKRRYELAMDDLREQKRRVAELEKQPTAAPHARPVADQGEKVDWETQKQRMLAALEADADEDDDDNEDRRQERLKIRDIISRTDAAIAAKDREIDELKQLLSAQSASLGQVAVGAAAFADVLSADEIVRTERERLHQLQHEWEEKLRQAEIDLSVQRARIARERAEIEERQRLLKDQQADSGVNSGAETANPIKPQRGRWLTRLGLKDDEQ